jgi:molybdate transport system substrate-binding protein
MMAREFRRSRLLLFSVGLLIGLALGTLSTHSFYQLTKGTSQREVIVFAGAAAAPVYREAAALFESKYGAKVVLNLGGSGALLSALEITKTSDVYIPGSPEFLILASQRGIVNFMISKPRILAYLVPAIIVQKGNPKNITKLEDLARPGIRVGIGDPRSVCIGLYAKEILERSGLWEAVSKNIVTYAPSCEATAQLVYTGAVDAVIGWHVFYYWNPDKADIVWIEPGKIPKIGYIAGAVTTSAKDRDLAAKFLDFLSSPDVHDLWRKYGYFATIEEARARAPSAVVEELKGGG